MMERRMKDSGIPWIGMIPEDWEVLRLKNLYSERTELSSNGSELLLSISEYYGVAPTAEKTDNDFITRAETLVGYKKCFKNDFVSNIMLAWKGSFGTTDYDGIISPAYCVYKPINDICPHYYHYLLRTDLFKCVFKQYSKGVIDSRLRLYSPYFLAIHTIYPPLSEQEVIASWLDEECGEIDELIEVEQKMIVELEAYRQAIITETVTRGLNPEAPMRQTGISWIPDIPEHWETITIRGLSKKFRKGSGITKEDLMENGDILCIRYGDLYTKYDFHMSNIQCRTNVDKIASPVYGEYGDILFTCSGEDIDAIGKSAALLCSEPCLIGGDLIIMKHDQYPKFLGYSISSEIAQKQKSYGKSKLKVVHTSVKDLKNVIIALPPIEEQQAVADYLDTKCKEIDELIAVKREKIDTLKQYRQSIIFEAVTGKIQVAHASSVE